MVEKCELYEVEWNFQRCSLMPLLLLLPMIIFITVQAIVVRANDK
jgi:hypothetical protein